ncbi:MAG: hypothetical protein U0904_01670 [Candidatus Nanopelagicales bacterium]|nr:hypothetical protein [Candidatus Nanopelagicales bacterium]
MITSPEELARLAESNHDVILTREIVKLGVTKRDLREAQLMLYRIRRGAYCLVPPATREAAHLLACRAALRSSNAPLALSHVSAAVAWRLPQFDTPFDRIHLSRVGDLRQSAKRAADLHIHHRLVGPEELAEFDGIALTSPSRTVVDCATQLPVESAVVIGDAALNRGLCTMEELQARLSDSVRCKGAAHARRVLELLDARCESPGESRLRLQIQCLGYAVESQVEVVHDGSFVARADFRISGTRVLVEFDGRTKYASDPEKAHWEEKKRHDRIISAGYEVVRVVWSDLTRAQYLDRLIREAVRRSRIRGSAA